MLSRDRTLHGAFGAQARSRPDGVALIQGETVLTYAELARAADDRATGRAAPVRMGPPFPGPITGLAKQRGLPVDGAEQDGAGA